MTLWSNLEPRRRIVMILAAVAMFAAVLGLARMASQPTMSLLYSGLENGQAGDIVRALDQRGVTYEVRGGSIYVEGGSRDELRMTLASEGLPHNSAQGYELLDNLSGFGTTSQMFDAAYWRAKEGELARTIASSPQIESARVHIAHQGATPFQRDLRPTASISLSASGDISAAQAKALRYLVASAVAGLNPDDVAVIDDSGELVGATEETGSTGQDRAQELKEKVQRLLEARVGPGNAVVEVSVDTDTESETIRERRFDPDGRVAISSDTEERSSNAKNSDGGNVTVASNLPNGNAGGSGDSSNQNSETRARVNYEVSETNRELVRVPGAIRRLTVAVLVNGIRPASDGTTVPAIEVRPDAELANLRELVESAVGFDAARGDVITIKSMQFEPVTVLGTSSAPGFIAGLNLDVMSLVQMAVLAVVALILGLFVIRPVLAGRAAGAELPMLANDSGTVLNGEIEDDDFALPDLSLGSGFGDDGGGFPMMGDFGDSSDSSDPVKKLQNLIEERKDETLEILRSWMEESKETA